MRAPECTRYASVGTGDQGPFLLFGGIYQIAATCGSWGGGNARLYQLGPDGSTYLTVSAPLVANGGDTIYLSPGQYKWTVTTSTGVSLIVTRVPGE